MHNYDSPFIKLLEKLLDEITADKRRKHEERMKLINMIADSKLRDAYLNQLVLNQFFLDPSESAQYKLQNTAKHSNWLAEIVDEYYRDHGATQEQGKEISTALRLLAVKISEIASLDDLLSIYRAATLYTDYLSDFRHKERKYSLGRSFRQGILNPLNDCIAIENNLRRRIALTTLGKDANWKLLEDEQSG